jgi:hypothetical protein
LYKFIATDEILYVKKHKWHQHDADWRNDVSTSNEIQ